MRDKCVCLLPPINGRHELACTVAMCERDSAPDLAADNARLRALVKQVEWDAGEMCDLCPWCSADRIHKESHGNDCPAFTPDGKVK